eukprot:comp21168_c0_seq1/m.28683 comp21168_c0_seq1/g.28683  ORF comp21168_c0_seq1/g.28683 comp21168_c0_seq1/m.28683 type:complete len:148 (-) comp21168_c0_seq1:399-842(-)
MNGNGARQGRDLQRFDGTRRLTAGCVCITTSGQVLLVSSRNNSGEWTLPKGGWDSDETVEECAGREAWEEGGVRGKIICELGVYDVDGGPVKKKPTRLSVYLLEVEEVLDEWPEQEERLRKWVPLQEAVQIVTRPGHNDALREACRR